LGASDLITALKAAPPAWDRWRELSFSHQREFVEAIADARKADTRERRITSAVKMIKARPAQRRSKPALGAIR